MRPFLYALVLTFTTAAFAGDAINIRVHNTMTKEVKRYRTNEKFSIPTSSSMGRCFIEKEKKGHWVVLCSSMGLDGRWVASMRQRVDCDFANNVASFSLWEREKESSVYTSDDIIVSCFEV